MADKVKVTLLKPWGLHLKGAVLAVDPPIAELLIQSKRAQPDKPKVKKQPWVR